MARPILSEYGPDANKSQASRASCGGVKPGMERDVMGYKPPMGPTSIGNRGPGLGGENCGNAGTQGKYSTRVSEGGSPGLHGENRGMGTNRKG